MMKRLTVAMFASLAAAPAFAHPGLHGDHDALMAGLLHPLTGADHLLALVAAGLFASRFAGRARLVVPAAFLIAMVGGFGLARLGLSLPMVEPMIAASVVALGLLAVAAGRLPAAGGAALALLFGLFHGHAHGSEAIGPAGLFGGGFLIASAATLAAGCLAGTLAGSRLARIAAALVAAGGAAMMLA